MLPCDNDANALAEGVDTTSGWVAGFVWALAQPYRVTLLHPRGQGFWWLFVEPPLLVMAVGLFFHLVVLRGLLEDLEDATTR